jgi:hypothetical protein
MDVEELEDQNWYRWMAGIEDMLKMLSMRG